MTFQQLLSNFLQPVILHEQFWEDQEMEKFVSEFGQWNGSTLYVNPTGAQLCYYKLPTLFDAVNKMFQAKPKGMKYSALTDEGFIEFSHHPLHDFYDINVSMIQFRDSDHQSGILESFLEKCIMDSRIHKISFIQASSSVKIILQSLIKESRLMEINGSFVMYK
jgi:hypothetical protein